MRTSNPLLPWLCVAAFLGLASTAWALSRHAGDNTFPGARSDAEAAAVAARTAAQKPVVAAPIATDAGHVPPPKRLRGEAPTQAEMQARMDDFVQRLDRRFMAEPLDAGWAMAQERALRQFFNPVSLQSHQLAAPMRITNTCHSVTCRVSVQYRDAVSAELAMQQLATQLAGPMPYGAVMPKQLADGSIEVNAWYSASQFDL